MSQSNSAKKTPSWRYEYCLRCLLNKYPFQIESVWLLEMSIYCKVYVGFLFYTFLCHIPHIIFVSSTGFICPKSVMCKLFFAFFLYKASCFFSEEHLSIKSAVDFLNKPHYWTPGDQFCGRVKVPTRRANTSTRLKHDGLPPRGLGIKDILMAHPPNSPF